MSNFVHEGEKEVFGNQGNKVPAMKMEVDEYELFSFSQYMADEFSWYIKFIFSNSKCPIYLESTVAKNQRFMYVKK